MPETENIPAVERKEEKIANKLSLTVGSPLKESLKNGESLKKHGSNESHTKSHKKEKAVNENSSKRYRVIMECELNIGTLCIFDADEYWTTEMINKFGCPHRVEAIKKAIMDKHQS